MTEEKRRFWAIFAKFGLPGLALAVFFKLYSRFQWQIEPVPKEWAGPLAMAFLVLTAIVILVALFRSSIRHVDGENSGDNLATIRRVFMQLPDHRVLYECPHKVAGCPEGAISSIKRLRRFIQSELASLRIDAESQATALLGEMNVAARAFMSFACGKCEPEPESCADCKVKTTGCTEGLTEYQRAMKRCIGRLAQYFEIPIPHELNASSYWQSLK